MNKVKIFTHYDSSYQLEKDINEFLAKSRELINVSLSSHKVGYSINYCAAVAYKEKG